MSAADAANLVWGAAFLVFLGVLVVAVFRRRRRGRAIGAGAAASGAIHDLLNQDKRNAVELIVEDKAAARDPEHADDTVE